MRTKAFCLLGLAAAMFITSRATGGQIQLFRVELPQGVLSYQYALQRQWPVCFTSGSVVLAAKDVSRELMPGSTIRRIYDGQADDLRWVIQRRNAPEPANAARSLFHNGDRYLFKVQDIPAELSEVPDHYWVIPFNIRPMKLTQGPSKVGGTMIINPSLAYDPAIGGLVDLIDSGRVRKLLDTMQNFYSRHCQASNHSTVTGWVKDSYEGFGIADVKTDTFNVSGSPIGHNVIATIPGSLDTHIVYIAGGHYDTYTTGRSPGADDNASGTVAAMEMARVFAAIGGQPRYTVRCLAFDAEELGLYGSAYYAQRAQSWGMNIDCMLNFDMIGAKGPAGTLNDTLFYSQLYDGSDIYAQLLIRLAALYGQLADTTLSGEYGTDYLAQSDSWEFDNLGYNVAWSMERYFMSGVYHTVHDSTSNMNIRYCTSVIKASMGFLATLANYPRIVRGVTADTAGKAGQVTVTWRRDATANAAGYKVYWGGTSGGYSHSQLLASINDTTCSITDLSGMAICFIGVAVINGQGQESVFLDEQSVTVGTRVPIFADDFQDGLGNWTYSAGPVHWDTTSAVGYYHSPTQSVTDSRWGNYASYLDSWIAMASGVNLTPYANAAASWWERYQTESDYDYCNPEYSTDNGGTWLPLMPPYSGTQGTWQQRTADLSGLCATTSTFRLRFRLTSDFSLEYDGWYVDDVEIAGYVPMGLQEKPGQSSDPGPALMVVSYPNPVRNTMTIKFAVGKSSRIRLAVYDINGRLVRSIVEGILAGGVHRAVWDTRDYKGQPVATGIYFYRLQAGEYQRVGKMVLIR